MGRRIYVAGFDNVSVGSGMQDIFSLLAPAAKGVQLHHIHLEAAGVTTPAQVRMALGRWAATVTQGSGGSAPTPAPVDAGDTLAAAATLHCNDTSQASTSGTKYVDAYFQWNVLLPFDYVPQPEDEDREVALPAQLLILFLPAVITAVTASGFIKWREIP